MSVSTRYHPPEPLTRGFLASAGLLDAESIDDAAPFRTETLTLLMAPFLHHTCGKSSGIGPRQ